MTESSGELWWRPTEADDRDEPEARSQARDVLDGNNTEPADLATSIADKHPPVTDDPRWGECKGALGEGFQPGAYDPDNRWSRSDGAIAQRLAQDGAAVHAREPRDGIVVSDPDAIVRRSPQDEGVLTEFATLDSRSPATIAEDVTDGGRKLAQHGGGDMVIDGRHVGLTAEHAEAAHELSEDTDRSGAGPLPDRVHYILTDNSILTKSY